MESRIRERYHDGVLAEATRLYGIAPECVRVLDGFESFIYEAGRDEMPLILRIGHTLRRSENAIRGEVDWINHLARGGAAVAAAVPSARGSLVERIDDGQGEAFLATAFTKAEGKPLRKADWTPAFLEQYGRVLGRMHALTKDYEPADPAWRRREWDDPSMLDAERFIPSEETRVVERYRDVLRHLGTLPRGNRDSYGLIHQDAHAGNFHVDEAGLITLFDFDDCTYSWFANDIAIVLFYAVPWDKEAAAFTGEFMGRFLSGYSKENRLDPVWLREFPHFLKLREIDLYAVIHRSFDVEHLDDNPWCARYMDGRRERIEAGVPYVEYDFTGLARFL